MKCLYLSALLAGLATVQANGYGLQIFEHGVTIDVSWNVTVQSHANPKKPWGGTGGRYHLDFDLQGGPNTYHEDTFELTFLGEPGKMITCKIELEVQDPPGPDHFFALLYNRPYLRPKRDVDGLGVKYSCGPGLNMLGPKQGGS